MKKIFVRLAIGFTTFWLVVFVIVIIALLMHETVKSDSILKITLAGPLTEQKTPRLAALFDEQHSFSIREIIESIKSAANDSRIKGLVLEVQQSTGSVASLNEIEEAMAYFRESGKWNAAFIETAGELSSGDAILALAATANEIYLAPSGQINLTGLRLVVPFFKGTLKKLEIEPYVAKRYQYKNAPDTFTENSFSIAHKESIKTLTDDLESTVAEHLAKRRKVTTEVIAKWQEASPINSKEAHEKGLVDHLAYWNTVATIAQKKAGRDDCFVSLSNYINAHTLHKNGRKIALIVGSGEIHRGNSSSLLNGGPDIGCATMVKAFSNARQQNVAGILFRINSPGGSYVASDIIRHEIELCHAQKIPVVVSMGTYAASGGYLATLGADHVVATPGTITGSIGVYAMSFATRRFWQNLLGVTFDVYATNPNAVDLWFLDPPNKRERMALDRDLDRIYQDFIVKTATARKKSSDEIDAIAKGKIWSGKSAVANGLVDELGGIEVALNRLKSLAKIKDTDDVNIIELPIDDGPFAMLQQLTSKASYFSNIRSSKLRQAINTAARWSNSDNESLLMLPKGFSVRF
ncbi:MAG: S49 family peptidase [Deltaproteobacteria bacterium]|nr:S49 family peptidase [Deltaproteobacteria bacterium]